MAGLVLDNVSKQFKDSDKATVRDINLEIGKDDFLILLGPSGCGKTTLLRMISGLSKPTSGRILIGDVDVTDLEPQDRGIGMVFQNYALYPHMTNYKNLSFGLEAAHVKKKDRVTKINEVGEFLDIKRHFNKKPEHLSGGERQRVAIGRAMVMECGIYLFDEPLSNLDDTLRTKLRPEILKLFHELKVPFVYVTHDQVDAMTMGTKIAVMNKGEIQQFGTPNEIYERPESVFVAGFVGTPKMNFIEASVESADGEVGFRFGEQFFAFPENREALLGLVGRSVILGIRPEDLSTARIAGNSIVLDSVLKRYEHLGNMVSLFVTQGENTFCVMASAGVRARVGEKIRIYLNKERLHVFDKDSGQRIKEYDK